LFEASYECARRQTTTHPIATHPASARCFHMCPTRGQSDMVAFGVSGGNLEVVHPQGKPAASLQQGLPDVVAGQGLPEVPGHGGVCCLLQMAAGQGEQGLARAHAEPRLPSTTLPDEGCLFPRQAWIAAGPCKRSLAAHAPLWQSRCQSPWAAETWTRAFALGLP